VSQLKILASMCFLCNWISQNLEDAELLSEDSVGLIFFLERLECLDEGLEELLEG